MSIRVVDLFSGAGGLSLGLKDAGFNIVYANEIDKDFSRTYKENHQNVNIETCDIASISRKKIFKDLKNINLIVGGPPCQGFSQKGSRLGLKDSRNFLFKKFVFFVEVLKPEIFLMENVPNLITSNNGFFYQEIVHSFSKLGYELDGRVLNASDYGVPQNRRRAFIVGNRIGKSFQFPKPNAFKTTVRDAISDLPILKSGEGKKFHNYTLPPQSDYQQLLRANSKGIYNHISTKHSSIALEKLKYIPPYGDKNDLPESLKTKSIYSGTWSRIDPDSQSKTITTRFDTPSSGEFTLNDQDRCLTVREAARIQSFPDAFIFYGNKSSQMKQVGNAVPPLLAQKLGKKILKLF